MRLRPLLRAREQLEQKLAALETRRTEQVDAARRLGGVIVDLWQGATRGGTEGLRRQSEELHARAAASAPVAVAAWDDPVWKAEVEAPDLLHDARLGRLTDPDAEALTSAAALDLPFLVPLIGAPGPLLLQCDAASVENARAALRSLILRIAIGVPRASFTLLDPLGLGSAFPMRGDLPRVRPSARRASDELNAVLEEIRRINQDLLRDGDCFHELDPARRRSEYFEFVIVADFPHAYESDHGALDALLRIGNSGPRAGRQLILEHRTDKPVPRGFDPEAFEQATIVDAGAPSRWGLKLELDSPPSSERQRILLERARAQKPEQTAGDDWPSLIAPAEPWTESAAERICTPLGDGIEIWLGSDANGQECSHGVLAGQPGAGKSYLLHVLITGLAIRYSPDELRLILVDGKQGVEFQAYEALPHAEVVSLNTSPALARSVLRDFHQEMLQRYERFQRAGVQNLSQYRASEATPSLPRMLLIVDEYQQIVEGDDGSGAATLARVAEQGRAAGMHMLLGSQLFQAANLPSTLFTHMQLRIAMQLSPDYVQGISLFDPQGKQLIRDLDQQGLAVVNHHSGKDGSNARGAVARLTREMRTAALDEIAERAGPAALRPIVIDGRDAAVLADNPHVRRWRNGPPEPAELEAWARKPERESGFGDPSFTVAEGPVPLWLGRALDVRGHVGVTLRRRPNSNLVVIGSDVALRQTMLAQALASLAAMLPPEAIEIDIIDGIHEGLPGAGLLAAAAAFLEARGYRARCAAADGAAALVSEAAEAVRARSGAGSGQASRLLVVSGPEAVSALHVDGDAFGAAPEGAAADLREAIRSGPAVGVHVVLTASTLDQLASVLHVRRELRHFADRVCQQLSENDSLNLVDSRAGARVAEQTGHPTAALHLDTNRGGESARVFKSYASARDPYAAGDAHALTPALERAFAGA